MITLPTAEDRPDHWPSQVSDNAGKTAKCVAPTVAILEGAMKEGRMHPRPAIFNERREKEMQKRIQMTQDDRAGTRTLTKRSMTALVGPLGGGRGESRIRARGAQCLEA